MKAVRGPANQRLPNSTRMGAGVPAVHADGADYPCVVREAQFERGAAFPLGHNPF